MKKVKKLIIFFNDNRINHLIKHDFIIDKKGISFL